MDCKPSAQRNRFNMWQLKCLLFASFVAICFAYGGDSEIKTSIAMQKFFRYIEMQRMVWIERMERITGRSIQFLLEQLLIRAKARKENARKKTATPTVKSITTTPSTLITTVTDHEMQNTATIIFTTMVNASDTSAMTSGTIEEVLNAATVTTTTTTINSTESSIINSLSPSTTVNSSADETPLTTANSTEEKMTKIAPTDSISTKYSSSNAHMARTTTHNSSNLHVGLVVGLSSALLLMIILLAVYLVYKKTFLQGIYTIE